MFGSFLVTITEIENEFLMPLVTSYDPNRSRGTVVGAATVCLEDHKSELLNQPFTNAQ